MTDAAEFGKFCKNPAYITGYRILPAQYKIRDQQENSFAPNVVNTD